MLVVRAAFHFEGGGGDGSNVRESKVYRRCCWGAWRGASFALHLCTVMLSRSLVLLSILVAFTAGFAVARRSSLPRDIISALANSARSVRAALAQRTGSLRDEPPVLVVAQAPALPPENAAVRPATCEPEPIDEPALDVKAAIEAATNADASAPVEAPLSPTMLASSVRFDPVTPRGTPSVELELHTPEWRAAMAAVGERFAASSCIVLRVRPLLSQRLVRWQDGGAQ